MNDMEKMTACCKLMAKLLSSFESNEVDFNVENITEKETGERIGTIKVKLLKDGK